MENIFFQSIIYAAIIIPSAIFHEYMHGFVADRLGDPTARLAGRLTMNPARHIDPWGTIIMPLLLLAASGGSFLFAYAKPVPYNPYNLRNHRFGPALVALAGPLANLALALVFAFLSRAFAGAPFASLFPIVTYLNVALLVFNLVPIPPLDGSKVLFALLSDSFFRVREFLERHGMILLLFFVFFLYGAIAPVIVGLTEILLF